jgi:hypothetical protein
MAIACDQKQFNDLMEEFGLIAHDVLDKWIEGFRPFFEREEPPKLEELSDHFQKTRTEFLSGCMQAAIEKLFPHMIEQTNAECPHCGKTLTCKRSDERKVSTMQGKFSIWRPYFYCTDCRRGFHRLDKVLGLAPQHHQHDVQRRVVKTAARVPFAETAEQFEELSGIMVGNHFSHETLNTVAEVATLENVIPQKEEINAKIQRATVALGPPPVLVVASDGAMTPIRPQAPRKTKQGEGGYREVKGVRIYLIDHEKCIIHVASWHQIQEAEDFAEDLIHIAERIDVSRVRVALLGDGAGWLWNAMVKAFPQGRQILDYYHCAEHVWKVADHLYTQGSLEAHEWAEATLVRLCLGEIKETIADLESLNPRNVQAHEEVQKLITYLNNNAHRIDYLENLDAGYAIGSGGIESANKFICHTRMKRSGAWWIVPYGNGMLRIRCAMYNGTYNHLFNQYVANSSVTIVQDK